MEQRQNTSTPAVTVSPRRGIVTGLVYLFEQLMPDPFVLSICLTLFVILLSLGLAPHATLPEILTAWYSGTFNILGFALQMILILATGYAVRTRHQHNDPDFYACRSCVAAHADRLCRRYPASRAANRFNAAPIPYVWRDNGHHERDRFGIGDCQSLRGDCNAGHARVMELSKFSDYYAADP
jgi:hypothetical protein